MFYSTLIHSYDNDNMLKTVLMPQRRSRSFKVTHVGTIERLYAIFYY